MSDWVHGLPIALMAVVIFGATAAVTIAIYALIARLATGERARAFKGVSAGLLSALGVIFGLLVDADARIRALVARQIRDARDVEWPAMAHQRATLAMMPAALSEALELAIALPATTPGQIAAQREIVTRLGDALDARRQRILVSRAAVNWVKWTVLILQAICTLVTIAMVHVDNRTSACIALGLFATAVAFCILLIAAHDRPFTGQLSVSPAPLLQVQPDSVPGPPGT